MKMLTDINFKEYKKIVIAISQLFPELKNFNCNIVLMSNFTYLIIDKIVILNLIDSLLKDTHFLEKTAKENVLDTIYLDKEELITRFNDKVDYILNNYSLYLGVNILEFINSRKVSQNYFSQESLTSSLNSHSVLLLSTIIPDRKHILKLLFSLNFSNTSYVFEKELITLINKKLNEDVSNKKQLKLRFEQELDTY